MRYRLLEHTSDLMVEVSGRNAAELFENCCYCLFDITLDHGRLEEHETRIIRLEGPDLAELFLDWIRELLFLFATEGFAPARAEVVEAVDGRPAVLRALLHGETIDPVKHRPKLEIKTPTYHHYRLEKLEPGYRATVVLDV